jgi:hypothetical protein
MQRSLVIHLIDKDGPVGEVDSGQQTASAKDRKRTDLMPLTGERRPPCPVPTRVAWLLAKGARNSRDGEATMEREKPDRDANAEASATTRRAMLLGAAAAGVGITAGLVTGAAPADASTDPLLLGKSNSATRTTAVSSTKGTGLQGSTQTKGQSGLSGIDTSAHGGHGTFGRSTNGVGAYGRSTYGAGVYGRTAGYLQAGVYGNDVGPEGYGVQGNSLQGDGVWGQTGGIGRSGVYGNDVSSSLGCGVQGNSDNCCGVKGMTKGIGLFAAGVLGIDGGSAGSYGVRGKSANGVGVRAESGSGDALQVVGKLSLSRSGAAVVAGAGNAPLSSVTVTGISLSSSSLIIATPQGQVPGVAVEGVVKDVSASSFTIYLTEVVTVSLEIGWFIIG